MIYALCHRLGRQEADILDTTAIVNLLGISFFSHTDGYFHTSSIHHLLLNPISLIGRFCFPVGLCQYCVAVNTLRVFFIFFFKTCFFLTQLTIDQLLQQSSHPSVDAIRPAEVQGHQNHPCVNQTCAVFSRGGKSCQGQGAPGLALRWGCRRHGLGPGGEESCGMGRKSIGKPVPQIETGVKGGLRALLEAKQQSKST